MHEGCLLVSLGNNGVVSRLRLENLAVVSFNQCILDVELHNFGFLESPLFGRSFLVKLYEAALGHLSGFLKLKN